MAKGDTFHCSVITPERAVLEVEATFVAFPAHDGEVGILPHRAPLLYRLGQGALRVETREGTEKFYIDGGFAQMAENRLTILTEQAKRLSELDRAAAERALVAAREMKAEGEAGLAARERALQRARVQLRLTSGQGTSTSH